MKVIVPQTCLTLCDPMGCSLPGSSVDAIIQARMLEWVAMLSSRAPSDRGVEPTPPEPSTVQADSLPLSHQGLFKDYYEVAM